MVPVKRLLSLTRQRARLRLGSNDWFMGREFECGPKTTKAPSGYGASIENGAGEEIAGASRQRARLRLGSNDWFMGREFESAFAK
jgi:hypothetical protein